MNGGSTAHKDYVLRRQLLEESVVSFDAYIRPSLLRGYDFWTIFPFVSVHTHTCASSLAMVFDEFDLFCARLVSHYRVQCYFMFCIPSIVAENVFFLCFIVVENSFPVGVSF